MGEIMNLFTLQGSRLKRSYIRKEADRQAVATWRFALVLFTLIAACIVAGAVAPQIPRVIEMMMETPQ
jgi:hypothetical protein